MVTILKASPNKNRFISVRWKLVSTYLLLIIIFLIIIDVFVSETLLDLYIEERRADIMASANIISRRVGFFLSIEESLLLERQFYKTIEGYSSEINSRIIIVDKTGKVRSDSNNILTNEVLTHQEIQEALNGANSSNTYNFKEYGHVMYLAVPIELDGEVGGATFISTSLNGIYNTVSHIRKNLRIISLASIVLIAIVSYIFASFISQPIEKFTKAIKKMAQGNLGHKVDINTNDEFKQLANAFNIMSTKLNHVDKQRKDFVANVSHELRTPLSSIKLLASSLLHQDEGDIAIYKEFLKDIDLEVDRLNNIINDLLTLVDIDKEKLNLKYKTTYLNFLLEKIVSRLKPLADEKSIELKLHTKQKIQSKIDADKIQQAVINIIHNAIKYTPKGGKVGVFLYKEGGIIIIKIKDNGIGIPKENLPHIFERFYRVDKARARSTGGTGLGLSIAHQIVTLHQGTIEVHSEVNKGSTFYIKIPYYVD